MFFTESENRVVIESVVLPDFYRLARKNLYPNFERWQYGVILPARTEVYNAQGSAGDIVKVKDGKTYTSMIKLWKELTKHDEDDLECLNLDCEDRFSDIDGAHVILDKSTKELEIGDIVLIIPLCHNCNTSILPGEPITLKDDVKAVLLNWDGKTVRK